MAASGASGLIETCKTLIAATPSIVSASHSSSLPSERRQTVSAPEAIAQAITSTTAPSSAVRAGISGAAAPAAASTLRAARLDRVQRGPFGGDTLGELIGPEVGQRQLDQRGAQPRARLHAD